MLKLADEQIATPRQNARDEGIMARYVARQGETRPEALAIKLNRTIEVVSVSPFDEYAWRVCPSKVCVEGER